jgi:hypothetical protein
MRSLKHGLMAAAALTVGMMIATPTLEAAQVSQPGQQLAQAKATTTKAKVTRASARRDSRAERDAREREMTKRLNEQQLQRR